MYATVGVALLLQRQSSNTSYIGLNKSWQSLSILELVRTFTNTNYTQIIYNFFLF